MILSLVEPVSSTLVLRGLQLAACKFAYTIMESGIPRDSKAVSFDWSPPQDVRDAVNQLPDFVKRQNGLTIAGCIINRSNDIRSVFEKCVYNFPSASRSS